MGRSRRKRGGGRVTPKRPRPVYRDEFGADLEFLAGGYRHQVQVQLADDDAEPEFQILVQDAESVVEELASAGAADLDEADFWASCIQSAISTRRSPDGVAAPVFLACAERTGGPAGAVLAAAVATYGPAEARSRARRALRRIRQSGAEVPAWADALGEAAPLRASRVTDRWGERSRVRIDFRRPDGSEHSLSVSIDPFWQAMASGVLLVRAGAAHSSERAGESAANCGAPVDDGPERAPSVLDLRQSCGERPPTAARGDDLRVERLDLAEARAIVETGLAVSDRYDTRDDDEDSLADTLDIDLRALLEQRLSLLPTGGHVPAAPSFDGAAASNHLSDFVSLGLRLGEHDLQMQELTRTMLGFAMMCHDGDILRWTPPRVEEFIEEWIPRYGLFCVDCLEAHAHPPEEEWLTTVESVFPRWLRFAAERRDLAAEGVQESLAQARRSLRQMRLQNTGSPVRVA